MLRSMILHRAEHCMGHDKPRGVAAWLPVGEKHTLCTAEHVPSSTGAPRNSWSPPGLGAPPSCSMKRRRGVVGTHVMSHIYRIVRECRSASAAAWHWQRRHGQVDGGGLEAFLGSGAGSPGGQPPARSCRSRRSRVCRLRGRAPRSAPCVGGRRHGSAGPAGRRRGSSSGAATPSCTRRCSLRRSDELRF